FGGGGRLAPARSGRDGVIQRDRRIDARRLFKRRHETTVRVATDLTARLERLRSRAVHLVYLRFRARIGQASVVDADERVNRDDDATRDQVVVVRVCRGERLELLTGVRC